MFLLISKDIEISFLLNELVFRITYRSLNTIQLKWFPISTCVKLTWVLEETDRQRVSTSPYLIQYCWYVLLSIPNSWYSTEKLIKIPLVLATLLYTSTGVSTGISVHGLGMSHWFFCKTKEKKGEKTRSFFIYLYEFPWMHCNYWWKHVFLVKSKIKEKLLSDACCHVKTFLLQLKDRAFQALQNSYFASFISRRSND